MTELDKLESLLKEHEISYERKEFWYGSQIFYPDYENGLLCFDKINDNTIRIWEKDKDCAEHSFKTSTFFESISAEAAIKMLLNSKSIGDIKMNKTKAVNPVSTRVVPLDEVHKDILNLDSYKFTETRNEPDTQQKIRNITDAMKDLLLYKNKKYGDSAINPKKIFYKGDSTNSILIRLDDKLGRVMSNTEEKPRVNDTVDIIGYCVLLLISMGVSAEDIAKFKD